MSKRLDEIKARVEAGTPGPWIEDDGHIHSKALSDLSHEYVMAKLEGRPLPCPVRPEHEVCHVSQDWDNFDGDTELITHAPADLSWAVRRIERLEGIIAQAAPLAWVHTDDLDGAAEWEREAKRALDDDEEE